MTLTLVLLKKDLEFRIHRYNLGSYVHRYHIHLEIGCCERAG
jgi:hypothetical protein